MGFEPPVLTLSHTYGIPLSMPYRARSCSWVALSFLQDMCPASPEVTLSCPPALPWAILTTPVAPANSMEIWQREAWHEPWTNQVCHQPDFNFHVGSGCFVRIQGDFNDVTQSILSAKLNPGATESPLKGITETHLVLLLLKTLKMSRFLQKPPRC